jgi:hypothetical protein
LIRFRNIPAASPRIAAASAEPPSAVPRVITGSRAAWARITAGPTVSAIAGDAAISVDSAASRRPNSRLIGIEIRRGPGLWGRPATALAATKRPAAGIIIGLLARDATLSPTWAVQAVRLNKP